MHGSSHQEQWRSFYGPWKSSTVSEGSCASARLDGKECPARNVFTLQGYWISTLRRPEVRTVVERVGNWNVKCWSWLRRLPWKEVMFIVNLSVCKGTRLCLLLFLLSFRIDLYCMNLCSCLQVTESNLSRQSKKKRLFVRLQEHILELRVGR